MCVDYLPFNDACYCANCMPSDECGEPLNDLGYIFVYPSYKYKAPDKAPALQIALEEVAHAYLARLRKVPRPLPEDMFEYHKGFLDKETRDGVIPCVGYQDAGKVRNSIRKNAPDYKVLVLVFCGHGSKNGDFVGSDGNAISQTSIYSWLVEAKFMGTVICVFNCCHADDTDVRDDKAAEGWVKDAPFKWVHIYSSGNDEGQKPSHAHQVARTFGELVKEPPLYGCLEHTIASIWRRTREPGRELMYWRAPPTVSLGGCYGGSFLSPAEPQDT